MELRQFISVFTSQKTLFISLFVLPIVCVLIYTLSQPLKYESTLTITIVRSQPDTDIVSTPIDDQYDGFYRLSADEKFSLTLKQWLSSPRIVNDILVQSSVDTRDLSTKDLQSIFYVTQASPQVINVQYESPSPNLGQLKGQLISDKLNQLTDQVNNSQKTKAGFSLQTQKPLTRPVEKNLTLFIATSMIVGLSLAILGTLLRHYYKKQD